MSFANPVTPSPSSSSQEDFPPLSPPMSVWSPEHSPRSAISLDRQQEYREAIFDYYGPLRRVFSFDEWDEQPSAVVPQPKVFHFDEWNEEDSEFDDTSTVYTATMSDGNDSKRGQMENECNYNNNDDDDSHYNKNIVQKHQPTGKLAPLDTTITTTLSSISSKNNSNMPYCEIIPCNTGIDTSNHNNNNFVEENRSSSSSKSVSSIPEMIIIVRKQGRWRRQVARSWRRIVEKSSRRCEV
jgi:hypothetical protein